jgi:hypothetical protein
MPVSMVKLACSGAFNDELQRTRGELAGAELADDFSPFGGGTAPPEAGAA